MSPVTEVEWSSHTFGSYSGEGLSSQPGSATWFLYWSWSVLIQNWILKCSTVQAHDLSSAPEVLINLLLVVCHGFLTKNLTTFSTHNEHKYCVTICNDYMIMSICISGEHYMNACKVISIPQARTLCQWYKRPPLISSSISKWQDIKNVSSHTQKNGM